MLLVIEAHLICIERIDGLRDFNGAKIAILNDDFTDTTTFITISHRNFVFFNRRWCAKLFEFLAYSIRVKSGVWRLAWDFLGAVQRLRGAAYAILEACLDSWLNVCVSVSPCRQFLLRKEINFFINSFFSDEVVFLLNWVLFCQTCSLRLFISSLRQILIQIVTMTIKAMLILVVFKTAIGLRSQ